MTTISLLFGDDDSNASNTTTNRRMTVTTVDPLTRDTPRPVRPPFKMSLQPADFLAFLSLTLRGTAMDLETLAL